MHFRCWLQVDWRFDNTSAERNSFKSFKQGKEKKERKREMGCESKSETKKNRGRKKSVEQSQEKMKENEIAIY